MDGPCLLGDTYQISLQNILDTINILRGLGLVTNLKKSILQKCEKCENLKNVYYGAQNQRL